MTMPQRKDLLSMAVKAITRRYNLSAPGGQEIKDVGNAPCRLEFNFYRDFTQEICIYLFI